MTKVMRTLVILVVVLALWLGGTAYISSNTKSYLDTYVEKSNSLYKANGMKMSVEYFEKGFFNSNAKMKIDVFEPSLREVISQTIKLPIEVNYSVENGPIFFKEGLGLGTSRIRTNIKLSNYFVDKKAFKKIFKDDIVLTSNTSMDFFKNASFTAKTNKIVANVDGDEIYVSPLSISGEMNVETFQGQMKIFVDSVVAENKKEFIKVKQIVLDADIKKFYDNGFYLGDFVLSLGSIDMKDELLPFELEEAKVALTMTIDENKDETIDMEFKLEADVGESKLPMEYSSLNVVELSYALNGTKLEGLLAFQEFTKKLQAKEQDIMARLQSSKTGQLDMEVLAELEKMKIETMESMMVLIAGLLKKESTNLNVAMRMIDKKEKESNLKMNIAYVGDEVLPITAKELQAKFTTELLSLVSLDFDVNLDKEYIANLPLQFQQELASQLKMGTIFGVVKENNTSFSLDVNYKPKTLMLNGQDRSEMLQMIEMGLSGEELKLF